MLKLVSVIIPSYNKSYYTVKAIESVLDQTYSNIEIIVVDDNSTDNTLDLLNKYKKRINIIKKEKNTGACNSRNIGMKLAKGYYIAHLDCDDVYIKTKIEKSINYIEQNKDIDFVYTDVFLIDKDDNKLKPITKMNNHPGEGKIAKKLLLNDYVITNSTLIAKNKCFKEIGGFDEPIFIAADRDILIRLSEKFNAGYIDEKLTSYRIHNEIINSNIDQTFDEFIYVLNKYKSSSLINSDKFYNICLSNIYYNYAKYYIRYNDFIKAKKLLIKILLINKYHSKIIKIIIGLLFY